MWTSYRQVLSDIEGWTNYWQVLSDIEGWHIINMLCLTLGVSRLSTSSVWHWGVSKLSTSSVWYLGVNKLSTSSALGVSKLLTSSGGEEREVEDYKDEDPYECIPTDNVFLGHTVDNHWTRLCPGHHQVPRCLSIISLVKSDTRLLATWCSGTMQSPLHISTWEASSYHQSWHLITHILCIIYSISNQLL